MNKTSFLPLSNLRQKILLGFVPVLLVLTYLAFNSYQSLSISLEKFESFSESTEENLIFKEIEQDIIQLQRHTLSYSYLGYSGILRKISYLQDQLESKFEAVQDTAESDPNIKDRFDRITEHYKRYKTNFQKVVKNKQKLKEIKNQKLLPLILDLKARNRTLLEKEEALGNHNKIIFLNRINANFLRIKSNLFEFENSPDTIISDDTLMLTNNILDLIDAHLEQNTEDRNEDFWIETRRLTQEYAEIFSDMTNIQRTYLYLLNVVLAGKAAEIDSLESELGDLIVKRSIQMRQNIISDLEVSRNRFVFVSITIIFLVVFSSLFLATNISRPVKKMAATLSALATGDLSQSIPSQNRKDEVGQMARAAEEFKAMASESQRQQKALSDAKKFQDLIYQNIPDLVFVKDQEFRIIEANEAFLDLYPKNKRDKVIGTTTIEEYNAKEAEEFLKNDKKALKEGYSEVEETLRFPDGRIRTLSTKKVKFESLEGEKFILGIARDITQTKISENELREANEELEEFAYRTSHDLRSPIVSSIGLLNLVVSLISEKDYDTALASAEHAKESLIKQENLIQDIMNLTKIKNIHEDNVKIDLEEIITDSLRDLAYMDNFDRLEIKYDFKHKSTIISQHGRVQMIVENLISNAIKYQDLDKEKSFINIRSFEEDGYFFIEIKDNGIGIPENYTKELFQMFKRFHPTVSFGSGLGMYMVKKSADKIQGDITYTAWDEGSIFTLKLPVSLQEKSDV